MKKIDLGEDKAKAALRFDMLLGTAFQGRVPTGPDAEAETVRLIKIQVKLKALKDKGVREVYFDDEDLELMKQRVFGAGILWMAGVGEHCIDILAILRAAIEFEPEKDQTTV